MTDKQISFVIVNHNYRKDIQKLLVSLSKAVINTPYEVIIVDNASTDGSKEYFSQTGIHVIYYYLEENIGYGAANNIGVGLAQANMIVLLNPDTVFVENGFEDFVKQVEDPSIGILAPKIIYPDSHVQPNCSIYSTLKTFVLQSLKVGYFVRKMHLTSSLQTMVDILPFLRKTFIGIYLDNFSSNIGVKNCDWVSGACIIMRKAVFEEVGGFDEHFFLYCEDEDLCRRIADKGYGIIQNTQYQIIHNEGYIKSRESRALTFAAKHRYCSSIYYMEKYEGKTSAIFLRIFYIVQHLLNGLRYMVIDWKSAKTYFDFLPELFRKV